MASFNPCDLVLTEIGRAKLSPLSRAWSARFITVIGLKAAMPALADAIEQYPDLMQAAMLAAVEQVLWTPGALEPDPIERA